MICKVTKNCRDSCAGHRYAPKFIARRGLARLRDSGFRTSHHRRPVVSARAPPSRTPDQGESSDRPHLRTATVRQRSYMKSARTAEPVRRDETACRRPEPLAAARFRALHPTPGRPHRDSARLDASGIMRTSTVPNMLNRLRQHLTFGPQRPRHPQTEEAPAASPETTRPRRTDATGARSHKAAKNPAEAFIPPRAMLPGASLSVHFPATRFQCIFHQRDDRHRPDSARDRRYITALGSHLVELDVAQQFPP